MYAGDDELVEVSVVDLDGHVLLDTLVRPIKRTEWPEAERIHGISPHDVASAPTFEDIKPLIVDSIKGREVVIYNARFDTRFIGREVMQHASSVRCAMLRFAEWEGEWSDYWRGWKWHKLVDAAHYFGYHWAGSAHRAQADALACRHVWIRLEVMEGWDTVDPPEKPRTYPDFALERRNRSEEDAVYAWPPVKERPAVPPKMLVQVNIEPGTKFKGWKHVPPGLAAKTWLRAHGRKPSRHQKPIARVYQISNHREVDLYRVIDTVPVPPVSPAQAVALLRASRSQ